MRRHEPDPAPTAGLAARMDAVEARLAALEPLRQDVAALGRGLAGLSRQIDALAAATTGRIVRTAGQKGSPGQPQPGQPGPGQPGTAWSGADGPGAGEGQPNWLTISDPEDAATLLTETVAFVEHVLAPLGAAPPAACWMLHPAVVVELVALHAEHAVAYDGPAPTPVSEWLSRWLPGTRERVFAELTPCTNERAHRTARATYDATGLDPARVAAWWVDTRGHNPDAVEAFALTRIA